MRWLNVSLLASLTGCSEPMDSVSLDFRVEPIAAEKISEWSVTRLVTGHHRVEVRRDAAVAGECERLTADLMRNRGDLRLRVHAASAGAAPVQPCGYTAVIDSIPPGRYRLRVVHVGVERAGARTVLDQPLNIR